MKKQKNSKIVVGNLCKFNLHNAWTHWSVWKLIENRYEQDPNNQINDGDLLFVLRENHKEGTLTVLHQHGFITDLTLWSHAYVLEKL